MSFPLSKGSSFRRPVLHRLRLVQRVFLPLLSLLFLGSTARAADVVEVVISDALGNIRVITDDKGNVLERHDYLPFGEECITGPCATNPGVGAGQPRKFTGKERDQETGLDYFGARYYWPNSGRFTTVDPVYTWGENLLDPQRWNRYAYARNNPLRYTDPDGRVIETVWDVVSLGLSIRDVARDPRAVAAWLALGADAASAIIPGLPATGRLIKGASKLDEVVDAGRAAENAADAANTARKSGVPGPDFVSKEGVGPYARPSGAGPTTAQRQAVQGKPCVDCGATTPRQVADHKDPLVVEHYRTGTNDLAAQKKVDAVQSHCPSCSGQQGGQLSHFSRQMRRRQDGSE